MRLHELQPPKARRASASASAAATAAAKSKPAARAPRVRMPAPAVACRRTSRAASCRSIRKLPYRRGFNNPFRVAVPRGQRARPGATSPRAAPSVPKSSRRRRAARQDRPGQSPRPGRPGDQADRARAQVLGRRPAEDRSRGRHRRADRTKAQLKPMLQRPAAQRRRRRLQDSGPAPQAALHAGMLVAFRFIAHIPVPGADVAALQNASSRPISSRGSSISSRVAR